MTAHEWLRIASFLLSFASLVISFVWLVASTVTFVRDIRKDKAEAEAERRWDAYVSQYDDTHQDAR